MGEATSPTIAGSAASASPAARTSSPPDSDGERILLLECRLEQSRSALDEARADADRLRARLADVAAREADHARRYSLAHQELAEARADVASLHDRLHRSEALRAELEAHFFESGARDDAGELLRLRREVLAQRDRCVNSERAAARLRTRVDDLLQSREVLLSRVATWQRLIKQDGADAIDLAEFMAELRRDILDLEHQAAAGERREAELRERLVRAGVDPGVDRPRRPAQGPGAWRAHASAVPEPAPRTASEPPTEPAFSGRDVVEDGYADVVATPDAALDEELLVLDMAVGDAEEEPAALDAAASEPVAFDAAPTASEIVALDTEPAAEEPAELDVKPAEEPTELDVQPAEEPAELDVEPAAEPVALDAEPDAPTPAAPDAEPTAPEPPAPETAVADPDARAAAYGRMVALLAGEPGRLAEHLRAGLADPHPRVRRRVVLVAATARSVALHPLLDPLRGDPDPQVRRVVREVLRHAPAVVSNGDARPEQQRDRSRSSTGS